MRIAIVDDEELIVEGMISYLENMFPQTEIVYKGTKPEEALMALPETKPELLFLDVEMPGMNGFELLAQFPNHSFDVIFTTAHNKYAPEAFKVQAANYLVKPIDEKELRTAVLQWQEEKKTKQTLTTEKMDELIDALRRNGILKNKIAVPVTDGYEFIETSNILYCESHSNYTTFFMKNKKKLVASKTLKEFEKLLEKYFFIRIHKSYLINPNHIKKYYRNDGGYLIMQDDKTIPVSKNKKELIRNIFDAIAKNT